MKLLITCLFLLFFDYNYCNAQLSTDDQKKHFVAGIITSSTTYTIVYSTTKNKKKAFWYSLGASVLAGFTKEYYDSKKFDTKIDTTEVFATALGGFIASTTIDLFVGKKKKA